jgi:glycosyltransferase involved in cell wall biosynthesis
MKIVYLAAGAADMYCGSCLHDNTLAAELLAQGQDILLVPTYTPVRTDEPNVTQPTLFYGGINVFLQQIAPLFRHTPWSLDRLWNSPAVVGWLAKQGTATSPEKLGALTVSMLQGEEGNQAKELDKLLHWLVNHARPDLVHLSNVMLTGMARQIRQRLGVPVVSTLSGEDVFLEKLAEPHYSQAREVLRERARDVDAFVALNRYYADFMSDYLQVDPARVHVIPHGLNLTGHALRQPPRAESVTIGFFARICHDKGLHLLAQAFELLSQQSDLPPLRLRAAGYLGRADQEYLEAIRAQLRSAGLLDRFEYAGELDREQKIAFLQSLDLMSVPTVYRESKGLSILEGWANGVPQVLPAHGTFPELVADTQGGVLCRANDPLDLADKLRQLILDPARAEQMGQAAHRAVHQRYDARTMAQRTLSLYQELVTAPRAATAERTSIQPTAGT